MSIGVLERGRSMLGRMDGKNMSGRSGRARHIIVFVEVSRETTNSHWSEVEKL
jgi:hypothetical protein